jgi:hypothetical protein
VKWSEELTTELPVGPLTVTSTVAAACGGAMAVKDVSEMTLKPSAGTAPNRTWLVAVNPLPVRVTTVPPAVPPLVVAKLVTAGADAAVTVTRSADTSADVPAGVTTVMSQTPAAPGRTVATIVVSDTTLKLVAGSEAKYTTVAPVKALPVITRFVPPAVPRLVVLNEVIDGTEAAEYVKWSADPAEDVPPGPVTVMSTVPVAVLAGTVATITLSERTVNAAASVPKLTALAPVNPLPDTVNTAPPSVLPDDGVTAVTDGVLELYVKWSAEPVEEVPAALVTVISTVAAASGGAIATII